MIQGVSFDAAGTLLINRYLPGRFARACAEACGIAITEDDQDSYVRLCHERVDDFWRANQTRALAQVDAFWKRLTMDWLALIGEDPEAATLLITAGAKLLHETDDWFQVYPDVAATLHHLAQEEIPAYVLSNWDMSLHQIMDSKGLGNAFAIVIASLEEGFEKPHPQIFELLATRAERKPSHLIHIGDSMKDDVEGALNAGFHAGLVDRLLIETTTERLGDQLLIRGPSLNRIVEVALSE